MPTDTSPPAVLGTWASLAPELRPSAQRQADGAPKPFYLLRAFTALPGERFELQITMLADPLGQLPLARLLLKGRMVWRGPHPIAPGAQKVDFIADEAYQVTPLLQAFDDLLNQTAPTGGAPWRPGQGRSVLRQACAPLGLVEGRDFMEHDLLLVQQDLMFWGARHVDGRGFDTEANRPTNLQIPLRRRA